VLAENYTEKNRWWDFSSGGTNDRGTAPFSITTAKNNVEKTLGEDAGKNCK
jgi:hypothetical protein